VPIRQSTDQITRVSNSLQHKVSRIITSQQMSGTIYIFFLICAVGLRVLRRLTGLLYQPRMMEDWKGKPKYWEKTCPSATLSTTNPTWLTLGLNPGRRGGMQATNRLSHGAAQGLHYSKTWLQRNRGTRTVFVSYRFYFIHKNTVSRAYTTQACLIPNACDDGYINIIIEFLHIIFYIKTFWKMVSVSVFR
jgi:hypothetical protein